MMFVTKIYSEFYLLGKICFIVIYLGMLRMFTYVS